MHPLPPAIMRAFVAVDISDEVRRKAEEIIEVLRPASDNIRWSRTEGLHLTLKFLGEVPPPKVEKVRVSLAGIHLPSPITLRISGAGYFPTERSPRVIWLGVEGDVDALRELAGRIEESLEPLGFPQEDRPFSAHLTLGRLRAPGKIPAVQELLRQREPLDLGSFTANEFYLYESKLSPNGSVYRKVARFGISAG
jgi:2'-5' RNA ligase